MARKVSGRLRSSFPYCYPSARILDWFNEPDPFYFTHPPHPKPHPVKFCFGIGDEANVLISSLREGPRPPVATSPRTHGPLIPDRETLRASAHSLCRLPKYHISYYLLLVTYTTDTASKGVARKVICCVAIPIWEGVSH
jgi:hypothetical protein